MSDLLTEAEVSEWTRTPVGTLRYWRHVGDKGPRWFKLGRRVVYKREDVTGWLDAQYASAGRSA
ncbi:DNA-binding protein [Arsenicicoccus sp. MKL-02]|uniref:DNA-binding protein n=1 Tax=Arsenicicoccus cauae TaxID=2663847 RepID=A0A6I3IEX7_9MICO|nr:DNA-binding protein [Arsenicicoccus cauae]MTB72798.1 DNA-binding protein [Arsenicicoccus cauae]